jgi:ubiquinone/menaquinone biosynthesis C-methylase UbiE
MLAIAHEKARELGREVDLRLGDAQALEFSDDAFDTVVCTISLCSIPDDRAAVHEAVRVLRPDARRVGVPSRVLKKGWMEVLKP